jgi:hypothetical protein
MSGSIRRPLKFVGAAGTYTWPRYGLEYDASQPLVTALVDIPGVDYAYDQQEDAPSIRGVGTQTVRFMLVGEASAIEAELDTLRAVCYYNARGWFYVEDYAGAQRRCYGRLSALPDIKLGTRDRQRMPIILTFSQLSDFQDIAPIDEHDGAVQAVVGSPASIMVNNPGTARVYNAKITLKGPFTNPRIENNSLDLPGSDPAVPYAFESSSDGAAGTDWLEIDAGANTVRISDDSGATWADDSLNVILQDGQVGLFALAPGENDLTVEGLAGGDMEFEFAGGYI